MKREQPQDMEDPRTSLPFLLQFRKRISFAAMPDLGTGVRAACTAPLRVSDTRTRVPVIWQIPKPQPNVLEESWWQHTKHTWHCRQRREKHPPLFPGRTSVMHKSHMNFFSLFIWGEETRFIWFFSIWCTFTVSKNEFCFQHASNQDLSEKEKSVFREALCQFPLLATQKHPNKPGFKV